VNWQRANIQAAAAYLRERIAAGAADVRTKAVYEGLLDVLEPNRRTLRLQRELADASTSAVPVHATRERRNTIERRAMDRRAADAGAPGGVERRARRDRRTGRDRRGGRS
jgi:hypothetical protein